jgi:hypothetical protein
VHRAARREYTLKKIDAPVVFNIVRVRHVRPTQPPGVPTQITVGGRFTAVGFLIPALHVGGGHGNDRATIHVAGYGERPVTEDLFCRFQRKSIPPMGVTWRCK